MEKKKIKLTAGQLLTMFETLIVLSETGVKDYFTTLHSGLDLASITVHAKTTQLAMQQEELKYSVTTKNTNEDGTPGEKKSFETFKKQLEWQEKEQELLAADAGEFELYLLDPKMLVMEIKPAVEKETSKKKKKHKKGNEELPAAEKEIKTVPFPPGIFAGLAPILKIDKSH